MPLRKNLAVQVRSRCECGSVQSTCLVLCRTLGLGQQKPKEGQGPGRQFEGLEPRHCSCGAPEGYSLAPQSPPALPVQAPEEEVGSHPFYFSAKTTFKFMIKIEVRQGSE